MDSYDLSVPKGLGISGLRLYRKAFSEDEEYLAMESQDEETGNIGSYGKCFDTSSFQWREVISPLLHKLENSKTKKETRRASEELFFIFEDLKYSEC